jgi:hypothetical protein
VSPLRVSLFAQNTLNAFLFPLALLLIFFFFTFGSKRYLRTSHSLIFGGKLISLNPIILIMTSAVYASLHQHLYKLLRRYHLDSHFSLSARFSDGSLCLLVDTFFRNLYAAKMVLSDLCCFDRFHNLNSLVLRLRQT